MDELQISVGEKEEDDAGVIPGFGAMAVVAGISLAMILVSRKKDLDQA